MRWIVNGGWTHYWLSYSGSGRIDKKTAANCIKPQRMGIFTTRRRCPSAPSDSPADPRLGRNLASIVGDSRKTTGLGHAAATGKPPDGVVSGSRSTLLHETSGPRSFGHAVFIVPAGAISALARSTPTYPEQGAMGKPE